MVPSVRVSVTNFFFRLNDLGITPRPPGSHPNPPPPGHAAPPEELAKARRALSSIYKVKYAILRLNVNNFETVRDIMMKLRIQRVLYHGMKWRENPGIFWMNRPTMSPFTLKAPLSNIIPKSLVTLHFLKSLMFQIKAHIYGFQMKYQSFLNPKFWLSNSWFSNFMQYGVQFVFSTTVQFAFLKRGHLL